MMNARLLSLLAFLFALSGVAAVQNKEKIADVVNRITARGIRNNNPGNLEITRNQWRGKVPVAENTDGRFEQFTAPFFGLRALARDLTSKSRRGLTSIRKILEVYAPPNENNTEAYIASVARQTGLDADADINVEANLFGLVSAITVHENGGNPYDADLITEAIGAA